MLTRKRKHDTSLLSPDDVCLGEGYKIIDSSICQNVLDCISKCTNCSAEKTLQLKQNNKKRMGMCETLILYCNSCKTSIQSFQTSKPVGKHKGHQQMLDINLRSVITATSVIRWSDYFT